MTFEFGVDGDAEVCDGEGLDPANGDAGKRERATFGTSVAVGLTEAAAGDGKGPMNGREEFRNTDLFPELFELLLGAAESSFKCF